MKTLSTTALLLTLTLSLTAQAELKIGDSVILKKDLANAPDDDPSFPMMSMLVNGTEESIFKSIITSPVKYSSVCSTSIFQTPEFRPGNYKRSTIFELDGISRGYYFEDGGYKGYITISLKEKNTQSHTNIYIKCTSIRHYETKTFAKYIAPKSDELFERYNDLFEILE